MERYEVILSEKAEKQIKALRKAGELTTLRKIRQLLIELSEHPTTGTGKPKPLGGNRAGQWSRRITDKHRLVYTVEENKLMVFVLASSGHYDDK